MEESSIQIYVFIVHISCFSHQSHDFHNDPMIYRANINYDHSYCAAKHDNYVKYSQQDQDDDSSRSIK
jgi:hypothetical protein